MQTQIETARLVLRELLPTDDTGMFELDSNAEVHTFLGNNPINSIEQAQQAIAFIQQQYRENGMGRLAVIEKSTDQFAGWAGLKLVKERINGHSNFYDLGYRLIPKYWGKGYATEAAKAVLQYGFNQLHLTEIYGMADVNNTASRKVLEKAGLHYVETFDLDDVPHAWFKAIKPGL
jgi:ribosomal-protein-alanine N-acetyltransferase